jgi:hypothetical protein
MNAIVFDAELSLPKVDPKVLSRLMNEAKFDDIVPAPISHSLLNVILQLHPESYNAGLYASLGVSEHTDDSVPFDITLGVVLSGDHVLYEKDWKRVGNLADGSVFVLNNKMPHAAYARNNTPGKPLVFIACDLNVDDFDVVCEVINTKL